MMLKKLWQGSGYLPVAWTEDESHFVFEKKNSDEITTEYAFEISSLSEREVGLENEHNFQAQIRGLNHSSFHPLIQASKGEWIVSHYSKIMLNNKGNLEEVIPFKLIEPMLKTSLFKPFPFVKRNVVYTEKSYQQFVLWDLGDYFALDSKHHTLASVYYVSHEEYNSDDGECLILLDLKTKQPLKYIRLPDIEAVAQLEFSSDDQQLFVSVRDAVYHFDKQEASAFYSGLRFFDRHSGQETFSAKFENYYASRFAMTANQECLAVLNLPVPNEMLKLPEDELYEIQIWDYSNKQIICSCVGENLGCWISWSPSGKYLLTGKVEGLSERRFIDIYYDDPTQKEPVLHLWEWQP